jgi:hypothetical protein
VNRLHQGILIASTILGSWLGMQAVHEFGHVLGAWLTGGQVVHVNLYALSISRTDLAYNPRPLLVAWAGPVVGVLLPLILWAVAVWSRLRGAYLLRFFAGFCLIANGAYIGVGSLMGIGDCGEMLSHGSSSWQLWVFGAVTAPSGLWLWHRQGTHFGLGSGNGQVDARAAYASLMICAMLLAQGFVLDRW